MALEKTPLHSRHVALGGKMVAFGGWDMPIQYPPGIIKEHNAVRQAVGLFDVSHMGEIALRGAGALAVVQKLCTNDAATLDVGKALYTVMCRPGGGIVDDCIVYKRGDHDYLIIVNASNIAKDRAWIQEVAGSAADVVDESASTGLIAVQGPKARELVQNIARGDVMSIGRFRFAMTELAGVTATVARTGYTGEDGFELACPADKTGAIWDALLTEGTPLGVLPIGLGARDTLRLEARLSLYGNDIDETTSPLEADLGWVVKFTKDFVGRAALEKQKAEGLGKKLVGFRMTGKGIARHDYPIVEAAGGPAVGKVTSGTNSITTGGAIGLGYVPMSKTAPGTELTIDCRGKPVTAEVVAGPFYKRGES